MTVKKKDADRIGKRLKESIEELEKVNSFESYTIWYAKTYDLISPIMLETALFANLTKYKIGKTVEKREYNSYTDRSYTLNHSVFDATKIPGAKNLVEAIIHHIENVVFEEEPERPSVIIQKEVIVEKYINKNFLSSVPTLGLLTLLGGIALSLIGFSYFLGTQKVDHDFEDLKVVHRDMVKSFDGCNTSLGEANETIKELQIEKMKHYETRK